MESAAELRLKGNACFQQGIAQQQQLAPCIRLSRLQSARALYLRALEASLTHQDKAAACKNLGAAHLELAKLGSLAPLQINPLFYLSRSASYFCEALKHGHTASNPHEWISGIEDNLAEIAHLVVNQAFKASQGGSSKQRFIRSDVFEALLNLCSSLSKVEPQSASNAIAIAYRGQAGCLLNLALEAMENLRSSPSSVEECLQEFQKCQSLLQVAEEAAPSGENPALEQMQHRIASGQRFCECIQAIRAGAKFAKHASESTNPSQKIDYGLGAIDMYKEAEANARGLDVEAQAIALISVGKVYEEILRSPLQAMAHYRRALEMDFKDDDLCARIKAVLHKLELQAARDGEGEADRRKRKLRDEMKGDLGEIQRQFGRLDVKGFLDFVYTTHPPLKPDEDFARALQEPDASGGGASARLLVRKAIRLYHPDANASTDDKWKVIAEEITKCLLLKYNSFKAAPATN